MTDALPSFGIFYRCTFVCMLFGGLSGYINCQRETPQKRRSKIPQFGGCKFASGCVLVGANPVRSSKFRPILRRKLESGDQAGQSRCVAKTE